MKKLVAENKTQIVNDHRQPAWTISPIYKPKFSAHKSC